MSKTIGGRGNKAPYETVTIRIPKPMYPLVYKLCCEYRAKVVSENNDLTLQLYTSKTLQEAIAETQHIIKQKKGAKVSLEKLLQVLYKAEIKLD